MVNKNNINMVEYFAMTARDRENYLQSADQTEREYIEDVEALERSKRMLDEVQEGPTADREISQLTYDIEHLSKSIDQAEQQQPGEPVPDTDTKGHGVPRVEGDHDIRAAYGADEVGELSDRDYDSFVAGIEMLRDDGLRL